MMEQTIKKIKAVDKSITKEVEAYLDTLTKPPGSLGKLEELVVQLAEITGENFPQVTPPAIIVFAGDHGVVNEGVSAFPQAVTAQMVHNFLDGGSAINVLANQLGAFLEVVDVGVAETITRDGLVKEKIGFGTKNFAEEDALTKVEVEKAIRVGINMSEKVIGQGAKSLILGEMGIGNTTSSSAILAAVSGAEVLKVVGTGTGISSETLIKKQRVIEQALADRRPAKDDPLDILAKVGGLEIAAMVGAMLGGASRQTPILVDGFISTVAAILATKLCSNVREYLIFGHHSQEAGHTFALALLDAKPLLNLNFRLGEGTGAAMAFPILEASTRILREMATFSSAGVSDAEKGNAEN